MDTSQATETPINISTSSEALSLTSSFFKKIEISNVGRFKSIKIDNDERCFRKNTFIFGKNTFGKSTLTAIFRSIKESNPDYVVGRKTIGSEKQLVKIIPETTTPIGEYRYTTDEKKWNNEYNDITIFDNHFVRESVYTQQQLIGQEQQKNIEAFMLGSKGVEYNSKITDLTGKINANADTQRNTTSEYSRSRHLLGGLDLDIFLGLDEVKEIDKEIEKKKKEIDTVNNSELISNKLNAIKSLLERYKFFDPAQISKKLSVNSDLIANHFNNHINQEETKLTYNSFLQTGSKLRTRATGELCPFCTQKIEGEAVKKFLETVDLLYNENYKSLQSSIKAAENLFPQESFTAEIEKIKTDLNQAGYILEMDFSDIDDLFARCKKSISDKKNDLASEFDSSSFVEISAKAIAHISTIENGLVKFQNPTERKVELNNSLNKLLANKERFGSWKEKCESYIKAKNENGDLSTQKSKLWEEYLAYADKLSSTMFSDINGVLSACGCNFSVKKFAFKGNQRQDLLVLSLGGKEVSNEGKDNEFTIKSCLSDSDKWILALSFFLATVKNDPSIRIVIMDDPVSSFDSDRKKVILKEIKRIFSATDKQLILLTHEKGFYHLLHSEYKEDNSSIFLKVALDNNGSDICACDPENDPEFMSEFNCWISEMKEALSSQTLSVVKNAHANIRKVMEHILKIKYPLEITTENTLGKMLDKLEQTGGSYSSNSRRDDIKDVIPDVSHHDNSGKEQYPVSELGIEDYRRDIKKSFEIIGKL